MRLSISRRDHFPELFLGSSLPSQSLLDGDSWYACSRNMFAIFNDRDACFAISRNLLSHCHFDFIYLHTSVYFHGYFQASGAWNLLQITYPWFSRRTNEILDTKAQPCATPDACKQVRPLFQQRLLDTELNIYNSWHSDNENVWEETAQRQKRPQPICNT